MEEKKMSSLAELFENLPCTLVELGKISGLNEVTIARVRDGKPTRSVTANKLLRGFSTVYGEKYTLRTVTGINLQGKSRSEPEKAVA